MYGRDWTKYEKEKLRDDVSNLQWSFQPHDPNILMADFISKLGTSSDKHVAIKKLNQKEIKLRLHPWITPEIRKLLNVRERLFARKKIDPDNERLDQVYKIARNRANRKILRNLRRITAKHI